MPTLHRPAHRPTLCCQYRHCFIAATKWFQGCWCFTNNTGRGNAWCTQPCWCETQPSFLTQWQHIVGVGKGRKASKMESLVSWSVCSWKWPTTRQKLWGITRLNIQTGIHQHRQIVLRRGAQTGCAATIRSFDLMGFIKKPVLRQAGGWNGLERSQRPLDWGQANG